MSVFGIVCEWNPFHNGHAYLIAEARRRGADRVVCVMSGCATQRGELAVTDPYVRAEAGLCCGADLVLQLPFPWSAGSADYFATAAVEILSDYADTLIFGSECGSADRLAAAAELAENEEGQAKLSEALRSGRRAAEAYGAILGEGTAFSSNDLLGVAYLRAIRRQKLSMACEAVARVGSGYRDETVTHQDYPSATAIRKLWREGQWENASAGMPQEVSALFREAYERGELTDPRALDTAILTFFRLHRGEDFASVAEAGGGIANRICALAGESRSAEELFSALRTKQYTDARLRRAMLYCMTGVTAELLRRSPDYTVLLGANESGRALLAERRKSARVPVMTKPADAPRDSEQWRAESALQALFTLARPHKTDAGALLRKNAVIF